MTTFRDKFGTEWRLNMDLGTAWRIEEYDFCGKCDPIKLVPPSPDLFTERITDIRTVFGMVWCLVQDQVKEHNRNSEEKIEDEMDFAERLTGDCVAKMRIALWEELVNFFPEQATTLRALISKYSKIVQVANDRIREEIETQLSDDEITRRINDQITLMIAKQKEVDPDFS